MLKLGGLSCELTSSHCNIPHQINLDIDNPTHNVIADPYELPFLEKSIDVVLMAHQLDYSSDPHRLLREVDRVLIDDGYLILTGFNPLSLTGLNSLMPWRKHDLPWSGRMFTPYRVQDWLNLLNFQVVHLDTYALLPVKKPRAIWTWVENGIGGWSSPFCSLYFIVARKRTYPLKPIKPHWKLKRRLSPLGVNYTMKP
jgi:SAM-dependent methyltransferase